MKSDKCPWWQNGVIYHIYLRSFADSSGNGLGDIPGLIARLDYLKGAENALDVDALWLSPFFPSPDKDFGYDVADYCAVDPRYGTLQDFDRLIEEAHSRGLRIILDLVFNHTSDQHPWFLEAGASRTTPRHDWYIWHDQQRPPNNWQSVFGGKAWEWKQEIEQNYLHLFVKEQPDLNWRNPEVRQALMDVVRFWLDRGVDGFRLDVFNLWYKDPDLRSNPFKLGIRPFDWQKHIHDADQPEMHPALNEFRAILDSYPERTSVGELFGNDPELASSYCGDQELHMVFNFEFSGCPWSPAHFLKAIQSWEQAIHSDGWPCYVLSNHDVSRAVSRYGKRHPQAVARAATTMLLTLRGTPFLYYGEELGMPDTIIKRAQILDPPGKRYWPFYSGRDPARGPMQWDAGPNAGFSCAAPWLPPHPDYAQLNVEQQNQDQNSSLHFTRALIRVRKTNPVLSQGTFQALETQTPHTLTYVRELGQVQALICINFRNKPIHFALPQSLARKPWQCALSTHTATSPLIAGRIRLQPFEAVIFLHEQK